MNEGPKYPNVRVRLVGEDGNAFGILARMRREMRRGGVPEPEIQLCLTEATAGDYDNLLATCCRWVEVL